MLAECDLDTERLRFLGGQRFAVGFLQRIFKPPVYECDLATYSTSNRCPADDGDELSCGQMKEPSEQGIPNLQYGTVNGPLSDGWKVEHRATLGLFEQVEIGLFVRSERCAATEHTTEVGSRRCGVKIHGADPTVLK